MGKTTKCKKKKSKKKTTYYSPSVRTGGTSRQPRCPRSSRSRVSRRANRNAARGRGGRQRGGSIRRPQIANQNQNQNQRQNRSGKPKSVDDPPIPYSRIPNKKSIWRECWLLNVFARPNQNYQTINDFELFKFDKDWLTQASPHYRRKYEEYQREVQRGNAAVNILPYKTINKLFTNASNKTLMTDPYYEEYYIKLNKLALEVIGNRIKQIEKDFAYEMRHNNRERQHDIFRNGQIIVMFGSDVDVQRELNRAQTIREYNQIAFKRLQKSYEALVEQHNERGQNIRYEEDEL